MTHDPESTTVLVTGASGFIGSHCVDQLLQSGYAVRGTLRDPAREGPLRQALVKDRGNDRRLEFVLADLVRDEGWDEAAKGCEFVIHVASPYPPGAPKHEDELIVPARDGTLRVLKAAAKSGTRRVVITSSLAAIIGGHAKDYMTFDENDWTNLDRENRAYYKSKTLAEKAAWEFAADNLEIEVTVINPGGVLGPSVDGRTFSTSGELVRLLMAREVPGTPQFKVQLVDVRDVAAAHLKAMVSEAAAGRRYIAVADGRWSRDIAWVLKNEFTDRGYRIPTFQVPNLMVRVLAMFNSTISLVVNDLGWDYAVSTERIESELNWKGRDPDETIIQTAESMIDHGIV